MSIIQMTSESKAQNSNVRVVRDYPGHEEGRTRHGKGCPLHGKETREGLTPECCREGQYDDRCYAFSALYMEETHVGVVLSLGEVNGYDDSDFYALVWNDEKDEPEKVFYASTRGWTYPNNARVDATPEVRAKYDAYCEVKAAEARKAAAEREARTVRFGKTVRVVRGRKVPKGFEGEVMWLGASNYGPRVGVRDLQGNVQFTALSNVEVVLG